MRTIIVFAVLSAAIALGGCFFHHREQAYVTDLPPIPATPYK